MLSLSRRWALIGIAASDICASLLGLLATSPSPFNSKGKDLRDEAPRIAASAVRKYANSFPEYPFTLSTGEYDERNPPPEGEAAGTKRPAPEPLSFDAARSRIGFATFTEIQSPPPFIIEGLLPIDVGVLSAPGGSAKSTLQIWQAIHIILGRDFLGRKILRQGPVLIISAEDPLRRVRYRAHYVAAQMGLSEQDLETLGEELLVEDKSGQICRLAALSSDGNLYQTAVVDLIIEAYKSRGLVLIVLDPLVFFSPGERLVNDGESIMAQIGARLVRELGCAVLFVHHSGKANAREGRTDQYSSRGGSALPDGMRLVQVLTVVTPKDKGTEAPPDAALPDDIAKGRILRLSVPKISDAPPIIEPFYLRRDRFGFAWIENTKRDPQERSLRHVATLQAFLAAQLVAGVKHSGSSLEDCIDKVGLTRSEVRQAVHAGTEQNYLIEMELDKKERRGKKVSYLAVGRKA